jgi:isoamylase
MRVLRGRPYPLGATWDGRGVNFALFSEGAAAVELCLFDSPEEERESVRLRLESSGGGIWQGFVPGVGPGQAHGFRVHGPYAPGRGLRFNPAKLLIDPYARAVTASPGWNDALLGYRDPAAEADIDPDPRDSAPYAPRCLVVDPSFDWEGDKLPRMPWDRTVIYECHVKGMTRLHPGIPEHLRGTYLGLASEPVIEHLKRLGITALDLLPVNCRFTERRLADLGLSNYWGYNPIAFFAPDVRLAAGDAEQAVIEFKTMVKTLHQHGIEIILDMVFNHTAESDRLGPTLFLRGIDNITYYRLQQDDAREYVNHTGCGNTLNVGHPQVLRMIMDSLRYWVQEMHVDGFRFDLASVLARGDGGMDTWNAFFQAVYQDPVLSRVKLIAEPWDLGPGGYRLGSFPRQWSEWNDRYRDAVRSFWRGDGGRIGELATRLAGSSDLFDRDKRTPRASINYVACHDGFSLRDLVSYSRKHNLANGEQNRDGREKNYSSNWGVEGPTDRPAVLRKRDRTARNLLATLALSQGVPMIGHGDEMGRSQQGNNNAYCQDNELSWVSWQLGERERELLDFACHALALRRDHPALRRKRFFRGKSRTQGGRPDVVWLRPDGEPMAESDWNDPERRVLGMLFEDDGSRASDPAEPGAGAAAYLLLLNADKRKVVFSLPRPEPPGKWKVLLSTRRSRPSLSSVRAGLPGRSLLLLGIDPGGR